MENNWDELSEDEPEEDWEEGEEEEDESW